MCFNHLLFIMSTYKWSVHPTLLSSRYHGVNYSQNYNDIIIKQLWTWQNYPFSPIVHDVYKETNAELTSFAAESFWLYNLIKYAVYNVDLRYK